jgi:hypothetical protein
MRALGVIPSAAQRRVAPTANSAFAVLDWPYASHGSYGRKAKFTSSKTTGETW